MSNVSGATGDRQAELSLNGDAGVCRRAAPAWRQEKAPLLLPAGSCGIGVHRIGPVIASQVLPFYVGGEDAGEMQWLESSAD